MLKGIPEILSPELLKVLCEMGHSDRLVIADGNFPVESMGKNAITIRCDGHGVPEILDAILKLFPLDTYVEHPVNLMEVMPGDNVAKDTNIPLPSHSYCSGSGYIRGTYHGLTSELCTIKLTDVDEFQREETGLWEKNEREIYRGQWMLCELEQEFPTWLTFWSEG